MSGTQKGKKSGGRENDKKAVLMLLPDPGESKEGSPKRPVGTLESD